MFPWGALNGSIRVRPRHGPGLTGAESAVGSQAPERQPRLFVVLPPPPIPPPSPPPLPPVRMRGHEAPFMRREKQQTEGLKIGSEAFKGKPGVLSPRRPVRGVSALLYVQFILKINDTSKWFLMNTPLNAPPSIICSFLNIGTLYPRLTRTFSLTAMIKHTEGALKWHYR